MIERRQIAIAYSFAVPILFAFLMFEVGALYRLDAHDRAIVRFASAAGDSESFLSALHDAEKAAQDYLASGAGYYRSVYADAISQLNNSLESLEVASKDDAEMQSNMRSVREMSAKRLSLLQHAMDSRGKSRATGTNSPQDSTDASLPAEISAAIAKIRAAAEARTRQEQASAASAASTVDSLAKYGGVVTIWIVGVAALLLFYDHSGLSRQRVEQRLQNDILESFPFAVFLTTQSGVVLYANRAAEKTFGYDSGELVAHSIARLHDAAQSGAETGLLEILAQLTPGELWSGELPLGTKEGEVIRGVSWIASVRVGHRDCRLLIHSEITPSTTMQQTYSPSLRRQFEAAAQTPDQPRAAAPDGPEPTTPLDSEGIAASHRAR